MRTLFATFMLLTVALSGCAEDAPALVDDADEEKFQDLEVTSETGAIRGLVLDPAITPVQGATVAIETLGLEATSNEDGAFVFTDLEPGTYFLEVSKIGYTTTQTSTSVVAGVETPPIVKVQLARDAASIPYVTGLQWNGFMNCQVGFDAAGAYSNAVNPCTLLNLAQPDADTITIRYDVDRTPTFAQSEMIWEDTQPAGGAMTLQYTRSDGLGLDNYARECGQSPLFISANNTLLESKGVGIDDNLLVRVFTASCETLTVVAQQEFEVFTHIFYGFEPPEGYRFLDNGSPVVPE